MAAFEPAVEFLLPHEGGLSNNPADPGGLTNFGISKANFPDVDVLNLTVDGAKQIYLEKFWNPFHFEQITSQRIANKVFDLAVNIGPTTAIRIFQQSVKYFLPYSFLIADGKIGPQTCSEADRVPEEKLIAEIKARAALYYAGLQQAAFLLGWLRRALEG